MTLTGSNSNVLIDNIIFSTNTQAILKNSLFKTSDGVRLEIAYARQLDALQEIGRRHDIDIILAGEKAFLQTELEKFADSAGMKSSLVEGIASLGIIKDFLTKVRDPDEYRIIDNAYRLRKNRRNGLPDDDARKSFRSHSTRLLNLDRSRMDNTERDILNQRRKNFKAAEKIYISLQEVALGKSQEKESGQSLGMGL